MLIFLDRLLIQENYPSDSLSYPITLKIDWHLKSLNDEQQQFFSELHSPGRSHYTKYYLLFGF